MVVGREAAQIDSSTSPFWMEVAPVANNHLQKTKVIDERRVTSDESNGRW
jgi:hypothetical protein